MKHAQKRFLLSPQEYERLSKSTYNHTEPTQSKIIHPNVHRLTEQKKKTDAILAYDDLSDFDKVLHYSSGIRSYLDNLKRALTTSKAAAILGERAEVLQSPQSDSQDQVNANSSPENRIQSRGVKRKQLAFSPAKTPFTSRTNQSSVVNRRLKYSSYLQGKKARKASPSTIIQNLTPPETPIIPVSEKAAKFHPDELKKQFSSSKSALELIRKLTGAKHISWDYNTGTPSIRGEPYKRSTIADFIADGESDNESFVTKTIKQKFRRALKADGSS